MLETASKSTSESYFQSLLKSSPTELIPLLHSSDLLTRKDSRHGLTFLSYAVKHSNPEIVSTLLQEGADPNVQDLIGETPLHLAVDNSDWEIAEELLAYKAEPNCTTVDGETPLHHSSFIGDRRMMSLLISYGADPNCSDSTLGRTPLHCAVQCEHLECVKLLLSHGADPFAEDLEGKTPIKCSENAEILSLLKENTEKTRKKNLQSIAEVGISEEEKNSFCYSFTSEDSIGFSMVSQSCMSRESEKLPTQKYGSEDSTAFFQVTKFGEDQNMLNFLKATKLMNYKDLLVNSGFDDLEMMLYQMTTPFVITHEMLENIGMVKHGHRARLLMKLEQQAGLREKSFEKEIEEISWECCQPRTAFTPGVSCLRDWLSLIKLEKYQKMFEQSGYEDHLFMISLMNSKYPVDDSLLCKIGIAKLGHRTRILSKLYEDARESSRKTVNVRTSCILC